MCWGFSWPNFLFWMVGSLQFSTSPSFCCHLTLLFRLCFGEVVLVGGCVFPGVFLAAMQPLFSLLLHSSFQFGVLI